MGTPLSSKVAVKTDYRYLVSGNYIVFYKADEKYVSIYRILYGRRKIFTERKIDMKNINCRTNKQDKATISVSLEIGSKEELASLVEKIRQVESVLDVERTTG